eukprot:g18070.t4
MLPPLVRLSEVLSRRINRNPSEAAAALSAEEILRQTQLTNPEEGLALVPSGWHPVRASFEVDKDSMTSFSISEDGQLYSALTSNNTCALLDVGVSQGKAAWEFLLEDDSPSDECSVFGIATKPPYSRCYNSSQSLWMRRAYNGVLYNRGRQLPAAQSMSKIHPGDVVRCEVDMDEGTVRFSVNGEKEDGGFDDVEGEVFPCAGSYRSGVTIRLLKMEVMGGIGVRGVGDSGVGAAGWDPTEISWAPGPCSKRARGGLVSIDKKAIEMKRMGNSSKSISGDAGTASPEADMGVGRFQVADAEAWEWVSVRATRGFAIRRGKHSVELEVTPVGARRRAIGSTKSSGSEDRSTLRRYPMAFGLCTGATGSLDAPIGKLCGSFGWWTDGSLRAHGDILVPTAAAKETLYGLEFLPLKPLDVITMVTDTVQGTLRYLVNGMDAGIAFGPPGSGAICELPDGKAPFASGTDAALFPACSLTNDKQVVQLRAGGTLGTQLWPLSVDLQKTVASLVGRLCATLIAGTPQDEVEVSLEPWLRSPLLSGGVHASEDILGESAWQSLGRRSWDAAWTAEQQGRLVRNRSFMAWEGTSADTVRPGAARDAGMAAGVEEESLGSSGQLRSPAEGEIRLAARVVQTSKISQGLVLWPEVPCVRLTAMVDGLDVSFQEDMLNIPHGSPTVSGGVIEADEVKPEEEGSSEICRNDQARGRARAGELVLKILLPRMQMRAVVDDEDLGCYLPALTLRVEFLVGRVVTATGTVDLSDELKASLTGSSTKRAVVNLSGGGEVVFVFDLDRQAILSPMSPIAGRLPQARTGIPDTAQGVGKSIFPTVKVKDESLEDGPNAARLGRFLDSISRWGLEMDLNDSVGGVEPKSPAVGVATEQDGSSFPNLLGWLGRSHPDPAFLRVALEKTNSYAFPSVEAPFLAALLKHGGLVGEAFQAAEKLSSWDEDIKEEPPIPPPTRDMAKLWGRVRQLRAFLRIQKQEFKMTAAEGLPSAKSVPTEAEAGSVQKAQGVLRDETWSGEKDRVESETEEKKEPHGDSETQTRPTHADREAFPATFDDLCRQMTERANFLLELAPSTVQSPSATAEGTSALMHHLAEELSDLPTPPPARLQSRLLRWRSEDHGKNRWKGVVDVLRVQSQLRRTLSMSHRPRAKSLGNKPAEMSLLHAHSSERSVFDPCIEEGQACTEHDFSPGDESAPTRTYSPGQVDGDRDYKSGDSDSSGNGALLDNETPTSAAIQACTMYVMTGGAVAPPRLLKASLRSRTSRAAMRTFGLQALAALLRSLSPEEQTAMSVGTSSAVQEALVFLRPAFQGLRVKRDKEGREVDVSSDERDTRHHYLKGLEGCSSGLLAKVQSAFEDLYGLLRTFLHHSLRTGQPGLAHILLTSWALDFESRDYRFLAHKSGILPTLQSVVTLTNTASLANSALDSLDSVSDTSPGAGVNEAAASKEASTTALEAWTPWSLENIKGGFLQGTLMARDLARHISRIPTAALPSGFLEEAGLQGSASDILRRHSMPSLMRKYSALLRIHLSHTQARLTRMEQEAALKRKRLEEVGRDLVAQMVSRGVPVLDEREGRKPPEVQLTALCSRATVPVVALVACTFARGVTYAYVPPGEAPVGLAPSTNSGNYFEVTVMNPGEKTTIGIGLADPDEFPATKQMPGWVDHSYGYHGDDGRKFGRGKTDSIWPTWVDGDVIGCGFDPARGSIWYTRNGELLGDGFVPVYESNLVPVVGFHSNGESVRVNFGLVPFAYEGPEVIIAPVVLAERELLQQQAQNVNPAYENSVDQHDETAAERKTEGELAEEKEDNPEDDSDMAGIDNGGLVGEHPEHVLEHAQVQEDVITPEKMAPSMRVLQRAASSLLRFLVAVSMRQASTERRVESGGVGLQASRDKGPGQPEDGRRAVRGQERPTKADGGAAVAVMPPTRERSMYGTPLEQMQAHVDSLHQDIFDLILRELRLGALTLEHIANMRSRCVEASGSVQHKHNGVASARDPKASLLNKPFAAGGIAKQEMKRSFSHGHSEATRSSVAWKGLDGADADRFDAERDDASAQSLGLSALEIGEVEPQMFSHLALLCSVRQYGIVRTQLAHPSALRSILSLLRVGSPRVQRCVLVLLGAVLPGIVPSAVDDYLPQAWTGPDQTAAPSNSFYRSMRSGQRKDHEGGGFEPAHPHPSDGLVGVLFSTVRHAYSSPGPLPGSTSLKDEPPVDTASAWGQSHSKGRHLLAPGCDHGFGGGALDIRLAEQCSSLLRELYKESAWKELIARKLLLSIRTAASVVRASPGMAGTRNDSDSRCLSPSPMGQALVDVISDAVAALAIIAGGSGVLYPGAKVQSKSGVRGTVILFAAGDAEAGVVFDGENIETCERVLVGDLEAAGVGLRADPDTPAQPVVAQLLSLLGALLHSDDVSQALKMAGSPGMTCDDGALVWLRVLSQSMMAVLHLSVHCSDTVVAACRDQDGDLVAHILPHLLEVALCPIQVPALITAQDFELRWRSAQSRILSALRLGDGGLRTLRPIQRHPLPPHDASTTITATAEDSHEKPKPVALMARVAHLPSGGSGSGRDALSAEESREEALALLRQRRHGHGHGHAEYSDPILEVARSARTGGGGRGRPIALSDPHRGWGRGWGPAMYGSGSRRAVGVGVRGTLDWVGRVARERDEDDWRREGSGSRRRLVRSDLSHRVAARGRRAASAESRLDPRRPAARVFHEYDRSEGFAECRDDESGALLVEFNDGADGEPEAREAPGIEGGSAGSADSGDTSQDGDETQETNPSNVGIRGVVSSFEAVARAERRELSARLASEVGVPMSTAMAALEAFGVDTIRARQWLQTSQHAQEMSKDELKGSVNASTPPQVGADVGTGESNEISSQVATENSIVCGLVGMDDTEPPRGSGEAASVPSAEEGLNLWESEGKIGEATTSADISTTQCAGLLCEHDLVPVLGLPRPAAEVGGAPGTAATAVTTSCLVREVDLLEPGSLLLATTGEGYAPDIACPCVTVASELDNTMELSHVDRVALDVPGDVGVGEEASRGVEGTSPPLTLETDHPPPSPPFAPIAMVMNNDEVLVETMDAETGLCLGKRVPVGELRHSTSFFGRELDDEGSTVKQVLGDADKALSILRARSLLSSVTSVAGDHQAELVDPKSTSKLGPESDGKLADSPSSDQDSLLKMLWRKVMDSPGQWISSEEQGSGRAVLGEMLAQEVLDSFNTLTTTSRTMLSGGWPPRESPDICGSPQTTVAGQSEKGGTADGDAVGFPACESVAHESLHPLCTPLSYGGHIKMDPDCLGMVIKLDSRSRTTSELLQLQFFSSKEDMLNGRNPVRTMHGHVPERAARAKAKGMEFFKIEEADSTSYSCDTSTVAASTSTKAPLPLAVLSRSAPTPSPPLPLPPLPPASVPASVPQRPSSVGPGTSPGLGSATSSSRRPVLTSGAMTRAIFEVHNQMARRKMQQVKEKEKEKEAPVPMNHGNSFRSFALPGVRELWFRFDAPPGAEKPPLHFVAVAGSLDLSETGTGTGAGVVKAGAGDASSSNGGMLHDHDEDLGQEELGLHALFTCLGDESAAEAPVPVQVSGKWSKSKKTDLKDGPERNEARMQSSAGLPGLPGCLAMTTDLSLIGGKWFYEATVECLVDSAPDPDGKGGDCGLVRIGWAHTDLFASPQAIAEVELDGRSGPEGCIGEERMQGHAQPVGEVTDPLMRTVSWLSESAESLSSLQGDSSKHAENCPTGGDAGVAEDTLVLTEADKVGRSRIEAALKNVTFPILGSDAKGLGVGLGEEGYIWLGGRPTGSGPRQGTSGFAASDVIGCAVDVDSGAVWFSVNGMWTGGSVGTPESAILLKRQGWGLDGGIRKGISPCLSVRGKSSVSVNLGATPFKYPPPGQEFLPVVLRDVEGSKEEVTALAPQALVSDKRVTFAPETKSSTSGVPLPDNWGFRFVAEPLRGVHYKIVRELELICRIGGRVRSGSGSGPSTAGTAFGPQTISIWRPKAPPGWFSVGDVASRGLLPPPGALVVRADATGCLVSKPAKFRVLHQDKATGFVIWRPVARQGQVSLGDFACAKKASKGIMAGAVRCVAAWAVEPCPVVKCLWREEKQSGTHAIWSCQNGIGTFFGSQTGGRMGKKEVTQGPHSRVERHKRKKKKKKKGSSAGEESSEEDQGECVKFQLGVGEGWALKGVSSSCITNEWCQESDVIVRSSPSVSSSPLPPLPPLPSAPLAPSPLPIPGAASEPLERANDDDGSQRQPTCSSEEQDETADAEIVSKPQPSVSWASWLLSFLLTHPHLRRLAMRESLFRTLVAYLRSPGAPHRLRMVPLLTLLVRSHAEFIESPPPLDELSGLLAAVLRECDKLTFGRGPGSSAWRSGDGPGGLQLETSWASQGLLLLTDLAMATRRAQDNMRQRLPDVSQSQWSQTTNTPTEQGPRQGQEQEDEEIGDGDGDGDDDGHALGARTTAARNDVAGAVRVSLPPFGTRLDEGVVEEGCQDETGEEEPGERSLSGADRIFGGARSSMSMSMSLLGAEDRALLEADLRNSVMPDIDVGGVARHATAPPTPGTLSLSCEEPKTEMPSRCLYHLLEIMDTVRALRDGWPSPPAPSAAPTSSRASPPAMNDSLYLDSILCEAWMDAVGPAAVMESEHPFRKGTYSETLRFPGAEGLVVFLDPRSSMQEGAASLVLEGKDKMISLTGQKEAPWSDTITFRGDSITYRFVAEHDGEVGTANSLVTDFQLDDWGFRFTVVASSPAWECARIEGHVGVTPMGESPGHEARIQGALSLLVELDQAHPVPLGCSLQVFGVSAEGAPVRAGLLSESGTHAPIYVRGDQVRIVPVREDSLRADPAADSKQGFEPTEALEANAEDDLDAPTPASAGLVDLGTLPDADAKLERLPSNTPVLRAWGEATGVEQRWRSASKDVSGLALRGASYVSNAATVEVGDSDADSKDGSPNPSPSASLRERGGGAWPRYSTLDDVIATALPLLSAVSSDVSDTARPILGDVAVAGAIGSSVTTSASPPDGIIPEAEAEAEAGAGTDGNGDGDGDCDVQDEIKHEESSSFRSRACVWAKDANGESAGEGQGEGDHESGGARSAPPTWNWAVKVQAAAMPRKARLHLYLDQRSSLPSPGPTLEEARDSMKEWTPEMDKSLLELLGAAVIAPKEEASSGRVADALNPWCCRLTRAEAKFQHQCLAAVPATSMHIRAALLLRLNDRIERVLPVIDLASEQTDSLGCQVREMNHLVLPHIKNAVLEAALAATQGPGDGVAVTLDNIKAMLSRDRGEKDLASSQCVFAQAYRQLRDTDPKLLRTVWDGERVFQINFVGEDGVDAGGVFREGMSRMVEDLFSPDLNLLMQCPNGRHAVGQNNETFVPNPQHSSPLALSMLRFVGRLMGLSLRTRLCLPFQLPGLIWKRMLGLHVGFEDLAMVDIIITQFITAIRTCEKDGLTSDKEFREMYGERLFFTYTGSDGVERELMPGGAARRVTFDNRFTFCRMVEQVRTHEFDAQVAAMAAGLSDIVPIKVLRLFTAAQLEVAVAGEPEFDIAFWKEHTEYKGYRPDDDTVEFFWKVIESMSAEDQSGFVRFAWGRSRLPPKAYWRVNMKLLRSNMSEESLPVSHTCFFSIELPPYTTEERMRKGLLTATATYPRQLCLLFLLATATLSGDAFVLPGSRSLLRPAATARRVSPEALSTPIAPRFWGVRRRLNGPYMMAVSPGSEDGGDGEAEEGGPDAGAGGERKKEESEEDSNSAMIEAEAALAYKNKEEEEVVEVEELAPLSLLAQGDSLPLSYRSDNGTRESEFFVGEDNERVNPYYDVVRRLSPTELIGRFMRTSSPKVQEAVRTTVLGLLGSLPRHAFETTAIATGDALANLMFQLQMTGYMFKNAEYRLSLQSSMRASASLPPGKGVNEGAKDGESFSTSRMEMDDEGNLIVSRPKISGKIKLTYNADEATEQQMEVDADAYMSELRGQVEQLESQLLAVQNQKEEAVQQDLLLYIKSMPEHQLQGLTAGVSPDVLESMRLLVETVMGGMGNSEILSKTLTQQTGSGMAQLCMWQLVVGFNLREMEAREDLRKNFNK